MTELAPFRNGTGVAQPRLSPFDDMLELFPALLRPVGRAGAWSGPRMDVSETDTAYRLAIELPGFPKEAIKVEVYENTVAIHAEQPEGAPGQGENWLLRERTSGKLSRTIALPEAVDDSASEARFADGVLYLTLQKKRASQIKRLEIN